jgi:hypothetical protein
MTAPQGGSIGFSRPGLVVLATSYDLPALASLLECSLEEIEATTYRTELRRIFGPDVSARRIGRIGNFRIGGVLRLL